MRRAVGFVSQPPVLAALAGICFLAISYWWLRVDTRGPDNDAARHINYAWSYFTDMKTGGRPFSWFTGFDPGFAYPPLVHLIGAVSLLPRGRVDIETSVFGMNLVYVPMLVAGAYGAGSMAGNRRTGVLAVVVALGTPMVISMFHAFMLDGALAGVVALAVWLILRSNRFASWPWSAAAGVAVGLGLMTKSPFVFFVAGLLVAVLVRGGWRQWRNVLIFAAAAALVAGPWYVKHFDEIRHHTERVTSWDTVAPQRADSPYPDRWTVDNVLWYAWDALTVQAHLPFVLLLLIGAAVSSWRLGREWRARGWRRGPPPGDLTPELLAGGIVGYLGISYLALDDPRYSLPLVVYCAVFATAWLARARKAVFVTLSVVIVALAAVNTAIVSFGMPPHDTKRITLYGGGGGQVHEGTLTLLGGGYISGRPDKEPELPSIFSGARRAGVTTVAFGAAYPSFFFQAGNLQFMLREAGLGMGGDPNALGPTDMVMYQSEEPEPGSCSRSDVEGVYFNFRRGDKRRLPFDEYPPYCPL